jgi:hypothetical protein
MKRQQYQVSGMRDIESQRRLTGGHFYEWFALWPEGQFHLAWRHAEMGTGQDAEDTATRQETFLIGGLSELLPAGVLVG